MVFGNERLRNSRNVFIVNIAVSNLFYGILLVPLLYLPVLTPTQYPYTDWMCKMSNALPAVNCYVSTLTIALMAVERCSSFGDIYW